MIAAQRRQSDYYNHHSNDLEPLQNVRIKPSGKGQKLWIQVVVTRKRGFRSNSGETSDGSYVRNRVHLRKANEDPPVLPEIRTVDPPVITTYPSPSLHSVEPEHCIPIHSTPQHEVQFPNASEMRTDTHH